MSYGFDAYLPAWQWRVIFVLDVLIKSSLIYLSVAAITLGLIITSGFEPIVPLILMGIAISGLHFLCLYVAIRFVARLKLSQSGSRRAKFSLVLVFANVLFGTILAVVLSVTGDIFSGALLSMLVAATNLVPVLLVALIVWISSLITRSRWSTH
jgi:hypothetical protein